MTPTVLHYFLTKLRGETLVSLLYCNCNIVIIQQITLLTPDLHHIIIQPFQQCNRSQNVWTTE